MGASTTGTDTAGVMATGTGTTTFMETMGTLALVEVEVTAVTPLTTTTQIMAAGTVEAARVSA